MTQDTNLRQEIEALREEIQNHQTRRTWGMVLLAGMLGIGLGFLLTNGITQPGYADNQSVPSATTLDASKILLRGKDNEILWQIRAEKSETGGDIALHFEDEKGKTIATLSRRDYGFQKDHPLFRVKSDRAVAELGVGTIGRGTEEPYLSLKDSHANPKTQGTFRVGVYGPKLEMSGHVGKSRWTGGINNVGPELEIRDANEKLIFQVPENDSE